MPPAAFVAREVIISLEIQKIQKTTNHEGARDALWEMATNSFYKFFCIFRKHFKHKKYDPGN